jgi:hypothetical protein
LVGQNLPFGLQVGDPITASFSAQINAGTKTAAGGFVTGFHTSGTGEVRGTNVPEPATLLLAALGFVGCCAAARRGK